MQLDQPEFKIGTVEYRVRMLDVFVQNHVTRKLAGLMILLSQITTPPTDKAIREKWKAPTTEEQVRVMIGASAQVDDDAVDYSMGACLSVIDRKQGENWAAVRAPGGALMFEDEIDVQILWRLIWEVLRAHRLFEVFRVALPPSAGGTGQAST